MASAQSNSFLFFISQTFVGHRIFFLDRLLSRMKQHFYKISFVGISGHTISSATEHLNSGWNGRRDSLRLPQIHNPKVHKGDTHTHFLPPLTLLTMPFFYIDSNLGLVSLTLSYPGFSLTFHLVPLLSISMASNLLPLNFSTVFLKVLFLVLFSSYSIQLHSVQ